MECVNVFKMEKKNQMCSDVSFSPRDNLKKETKKIKCLCCRFWRHQNHTNNLPECFRPSYIFINVTAWKYKSPCTKSSPLFFSTQTVLSGWIIKMIQLQGSGTILAWRHVFLRLELVLWRLLLKLHYVVREKLKRWASLEEFQNDDKFH